VVTLDQHKTKINYIGWRKEQTFEFEIDPSCLLPKLFKLHFNDLKYSIEVI
jgi:hypothetical protein